MSLKQRLRDDLTGAIRSRDEVRTATLRMALSAISTAEVAGTTARELSDDEVLAVLTKESKKRRESVTAYDAAGRDDLAGRERAESEVLAEYLPERLSDEDVAALVHDAVTRTGADGPRAMGAVMKSVQEELRGRADGAAVAAEVRRQLGALG